MIAQIRGTIRAADPERAVVALQPEGIGIVLRVSVSQSLLNRVRLDDVASFPTHLHVGDSGPELFGFDDAAELKVFALLLTVPRIGPRLAQRIVSELSPRRIAAAVNGEDEKTLKSVSGVGARAASRIVVDLKGKVSEAEFAGALAPGDTSDGAEEALAVLEGLGYPRAVAADALAAGARPGMTVEQQISAALGTLA
jgi:Holliday junction DNA helicase RuvA